MSARCTMSFDAPVFYVDSSDLNLFDNEDDLKKVRSARVYDIPKSNDLFTSTTIAFCDKDGAYLFLDVRTCRIVVGEVVTKEVANGRPLKDFDNGLLNLAYHHNILLDDIKIEKDPNETDYWKVTVGDLLYTDL